MGHYFINFVELESAMVHAKFQDHRTSGEGFKGFHHIWSWRPACSCNLDHLYTTQTLISINIQISIGFNAMKLLLRHSVTYDSSL